MEKEATFIVLILILLGTIFAAYGIIGISRRKISIMHRNHALEGRGAVLLSIVLMVTGIGLILSVFI